MSWPNMSDYQEAIQNPKSCFFDNELKYGTPVLNNLGLPKPISGGFACVYHMICGVRNYAVRCFLSKTYDQEKRYKIISNYLNKINLTYMVGFEFLSKGIKVNGQWFPILKMEWIDGEPLNIYIEKNLTNPKKIEALASNFIKLIEDLKKHSIAHGDLQHGNILVTNDNLKLIDYDGLYVPGLEVIPSIEYGHRNYQHPSRQEKDFGPDLDNFSAWIIYASIVALCLDSNLWNQLEAGDEFLIFRKEDFLDPNHSYAFQLFELSTQAPMQFYCDQLKKILNLNDLSKIPLVKTISFTVSKNVLNNTSQSLPTWLQDYDEIKTISNDVISKSVSTIIDPSENDSLTENFDKLIIDRFLIGTWTLYIATSSTFFILGFINSQMLSYILILWSAVVSLIIGFKYNKQPSVISKAILTKKSKNLKNELGEINEKIIQYNNEKKFLVKEELNQIYKFNKEQRESDLLEKNELENENKVSISKNFDLNTKLNSNKIIEQNELNDALKQFQNKFIINKLKKFILKESSVHGIGPQLIKSLHSAGINTAGDILNIFITQNSWNYNSEVAYINVNGKGRIRVDGIGPVKAKALFEWKKNLESKIKKPTSIPLAEQNAIKLKYQQKKNLLENEIEQLKKSHNKKTTEIRAKYISNRKNQTNQLEISKKSYKQKANEYDIKINNENKKLSQIENILNSMNNFLDKNKNINFKNYLKQIFWLK